MPRKILLTVCLLILAPWRPGLTAEPVSQAVVADMLGCVRQGLEQAYDITAQDWDLEACNFAIPPHSNDPLILGELKNLRERVSQADPEARTSCRQLWQQDAAWLSDAYQQLLQSQDWEYTKNALVDDPERDLPPLEQQIFYRAEIDGLYSKRLIERLRNKQAFPDCFNVFDILNMIRSQNVAFMAEIGGLEKFKDGHFSRPIFQAFWLIHQHADFYPDLQEQALAIFTEYGPEQDLPPILIKSMKQRLERRKAQN